MRLVIKIRITWANKNILEYLPKYKSPLPPPAEQSGIQPYTGIVLRSDFWKDRRAVRVLGEFFLGEAHLTLVGAEPKAQAASAVSSGSSISLNSVPELHRERIL